MGLVLSHFPMVKFMKVNLMKIKEMAMEKGSLIKMFLSMRVNGKTINIQEEVYFTILSLKNIQISLNPSSPILTN